MLVERLHIPYSGKFSVVEYPFDSKNNFFNFNFLPGIISTYMCALHGRVMCIHCACAGSFIALIAAGHITSVRGSLGWFEK